MKQENPEANTQTTAPKRDANRGVLIRLTPHEYHLLEQLRQTYDFKTVTGLSYQLFRMVLSELSEVNNLSADVTKAMQAVRLKQFEGAEQVPHISKDIESGAKKQDEQIRFWVDQFISLHYVNLYKAYARLEQTPYPRTGEQPLDIFQSIVAKLYFIDGKFRNYKALEAFALSLFSRH